MADDNANELLRLSDRMFSTKYRLDVLWQRLAEEFHPERADFTRNRIDGDEFAENMFESTPAQNRRELAYAMGSLMRPPAKKWFKLKPSEDERKTDRAMVWLGWANDRMRSILYARQSGWQRAMQESDNDVVSFGNAVLSMTECHERTGQVIYEAHHLRDCAWTHDRHKVVNRLDRKMKITLADWEKTFPGVPLSQDRAKRREKDPFGEIEVRHIALPCEAYEMYRKAKKGEKKKPHVSVYVDVEKREIIKEGGYFEFPYYVRRWNLKYNSPYGYSPAAMLGLVDARVLQAQSRLILDAGELAVRPPLLARDEVLGEAGVYAGAILFMDADYDERKGEALRPLDLGSNLQIGLEQKQDTRAILAAAWFLNKLTLPADKDMTAYEVGERLAEYIRSIGPVVEPFEADNTGLLDSTFSMGLRLGRFGPREQIPPEIRGVDLAYDFDTPIQIAYSRQKAMRARETITALGENIKLTGKPELADNYDLDRLTRDQARAIDGEATWLVAEEERDEGRAQRAQQMQMEQTKANLAQGMQAIGGAADLVPKLAAAKQQLPQLMDQSGGGADVDDQGMGGEWPAMVPDFLPDGDYAAA